MQFLFSVLLLLLVSLCGAVNVNVMPARSVVRRFSTTPRFKGSRKLAFLVDQPPLILEYHNGPIMSATADIPVYLIWYGSFNLSQASIVRDFFSSLQANASSDQPSVSRWWNLTNGYKDGSGLSVGSSMHIGGEQSDGSYSNGKSLVNADLEGLILKSLAVFPSDTNAMYIILTSDDVEVEDFCMNSCASHFSTTASAATNGKQLPYIWVGNAATQCPGMCAWPYAQAEYGPNTPPLKAPNDDVGMDGLLINLGSMLAGTATNPFNNGFYEGDGGAPLEASTACAGIYGQGAFSGYPGKLLADGSTGASYNVCGVNGRKFLMPAIWNPDTLVCTTPS